MRLRRWVYGINEGLEMKKLIKNFKYDLNPDKDGVTKINEKIKIFSSTRKSKIFGEQGNFKEVSSFLETLAFPRIPKIRRIFQDIKRIPYFLYNKDHILVYTRLIISYHSSTKTKGS